MLKKDQYGLGILIGLLLPIISFFMIYLFTLILINVDIVNYQLELKSHFLLSMAINVIPIRFYLVSLKYDKTGRGVLLITFILVMSFFALNDWIVSLAELL